MPRPDSSRGCFQEHPRKSATIRKGDTSVFEKSIKVTHPVVISSKAPWLNCRPRLLVESLVPIPGEDRYALKIFDERSQITFM